MSCKIPLSRSLLFFEKYPILRKVEDQEFYSCNAIAISDLNCILETKQESTCIFNYSDLSEPLISRG